MYISKSFQNNDLPEIISFLKQNEFGTLITIRNGESTANHIPFLVQINEENQITLYGHIARKNEQCESIQKSVNALCTFLGPHAYVSSSWYKHINAPTWNYIAVHLYGKLHELNSDEMNDMLSRMVEKYEAERKERFHISSMSSEQYKSMINEIIGFKIEVEKIEAKNILSQNRNDEDRKSIVENLRKENNTGADAIADLIHKK